MLDVMGRRVLGAVLLDADVYEEVEADRAATVQAAIVVVLASLLWAGGLFFVSGGVGMLVRSVLGEIVGWIAWAVLTYLIGTRLFRGTADVGEMLRVLGFAYAPHALGIIPVLGHVVGNLWALVCMVVAIRQGLDFTTARAILTALLGWIISTVVSILLAGMLARHPAF